MPAHFPIAVAKYTALAQQNTTSLGFMANSPTNRYRFVAPYMKSLLHDHLERAKETLPFLWFSMDEERVTLRYAYHDENKPFALIKRVTSSDHPSLEEPPPSFDALVEQARRSLNVVHFYMLRGYFSFFMRGSEAFTIEDYWCDDNTFNVYTVDPNSDVGLVFMIDMAYLNRIKINWNDQIEKISARISDAEMRPLIDTLLKEKKS